MKALIDIERQIWGKVKDFATVRDISVSSAVELLLKQTLTESGYFLMDPERVLNWSNMNTMQISTNTLHVKALDALQELQTKLQ
jgi:hypothetical protein